VPACTVKAQLPLPSVVVVCVTALPRPSVPVSCSVTPAMPGSPALRWPLPLRSSYTRPDTALFCTVIWPSLKLLPPSGSMPPTVSAEPVVTMCARLVSTVPLAGAAPPKRTGMRTVAVPLAGIEVMAQLTAVPPTAPVQVGAAGVKLPPVTVNTGVPVSTSGEGSVSVKLVVSAGSGPLLRSCTSQSKVCEDEAVASGVAVPVDTAALETTCTSALKRNVVFSATVLLSCTASRRRSARPGRSRPWRCSGRCRATRP
jgi:hypothetical protein